MEERGVERGLGGHYDGRYRVFDHSVAGLLCMLLCWGLNREGGGGRPSWYGVGLILAGGSVLVRIQENA